MLPRTQTPAPGGAASAGTPVTPEDHPSALPWLRIFGAAAGRMVVMLVVIMAVWSVVPAAFVSVTNSTAARWLVTPHGSRRIDWDVTDFGRETGCG